MQRERRRALPSSVARLGLAVGLIALAACSKDDNNRFSEGGNGSLADTITVSAATSLTNAFNEMVAAFNSVRPFVNVNLNFGASSALGDAIVAGAPADVFASADQTNMTKLQDANLVYGNPRTFAHNTLVIAVKPGNPKHIASVADLATAGTVALCAVEVPCGKYAAQALVSAKVTIEESHVTRGQNVAATLDQVAEGDAVAAIVYVTDAMAKADQIDTVTIPATQNVIAAYPIAALGATERPAATAFVRFVAGKSGQRILKKYGFLP